MSEYYLSQKQLKKIQVYFPKSHGIRRVDDRKVLSGIIYVIKHGLQWKDAPKEYGPYKTLYNRFVRWSKNGIFNKIFKELVKATVTDERLMIDSTYLKVHRTAASLQKKGCWPPNWSHERRIDYKTACSLQRIRTTTVLVS